MNKFPLALDLQLFAQEKTEKATPKKRQDSRQKGQVAKSHELPGAFILLFGFLFLLFFGGYFKEHIFRIFTEYFNDYMLWNLTQQNVLSLFSKLAYQLMLIVGPFMLMAVVIGLIGNYLQVGFLITADPLMPKLNKLNPLEGLKKIVSLRSLVEFLKSMLKMSVIAMVVYSSLWGERAQIVSLSHMPISGILQYASNVTLMLGIKIAVTLIILAVFDFFYQRYEHEKSLKMSKQDIKDEHKKSEGDPLIKGKIREKQRRMALQRMMQEVPRADVVITNPTHFAVAIQYESGKMTAPTVVAKGQDYVALKIKQVAQENDVMIMENKPLARALFEQVEIGESIPEALFQAVAEVLAHVYKLKGKAV
ncbi:flagellar biosynthesis protein FlhB [Ferviditalea candida]|uniref:Flagellar biosynthetic protein FlhB n=1 Tax=Ferviditalea candida TaxID=3108399 RepID=A0ABU5ZG22_9BACL|nr:flagellar biosynthesis protein FlhB [Paenibacillaceae bacterium T2]